MFEAFQEDNSLVPRRHIHVAAERPTATELFGRARDLKARAEQRVSHIDELLDRLICES